MSVLALLAAVLASACADDAEPGDPIDATTDQSRTAEAKSGASLVVLGDSNAHQSSCYDCRIFPDQVAGELGEALGSGVEVLNLAWAIDNPKAAEVSDILDFVTTDASARDELAEAEAVLVLVSQNDLAYNRIDDPCAVASDYPRIRWTDLTHECMDAALAQYARDLGSVLDEIDELRNGRPTMLRLITAVNTAIGDVVDPTWNSPEAVEPTTYNVTRMAAVQCRLAKRHGGDCADVLHVLNGPTGSESAQAFLNPADATHLAQTGHDAVAESVMGLGFQPLVGTG